MLNEWTDRLPSREAGELDRHRIVEEFDRRLRAVERSILNDETDRRLITASFFRAMQHFLALRTKLFPGLPADPAWRILATLAREPELSPRTSVTGIAYGAEVPLTTALRYISALEVEGVIERVPCPTDKRRVLIRLTAEGQRRLDEIAECWKLRLLLVVAIPCVLLVML